MNSLDTYFETHRETILKEYEEFLRFPSISSEPKHQADVLRCADWLEQYLKDMGLKTERWETEGHPALFATYSCLEKGQPTLLLYNHYDVQPIDPIDLWESDPFNPTIRDGEVYARGAQDNKGQCFYVLQALKALLAEEGTLPINIKLLIEGEEEIASLHLPPVLQQKKEQLKADYLAIVDLGIPAADTPAVNLGCRGLATMDLTLTGSHADLHSGSHGGIVYNPLHALVEMLAKLRNEEGSITVPGFYDGLSSLSKEERETFDFHFDEDRYKKEIGAHATGGEQNLSPMERAWLRPTLEINGITGGYQGEGFKTVIPAQASAKLSCRLVPHQNPDTISKKVESFLHSLTPPGLTLTVNRHLGAGKALRTDPNSPIVHAFADAYKEVFQKSTCSHILGGGSIPIAAELRDTCEGECIGMGLGLDTDQIHAPNEHFGLDRLKKGMLIIGRTLQLLKK